MERLLLNTSAVVRRAIRNGREHLVAPVTLIVPGVLSGSKGSLYYPPEEVSRNPSVWDNFPLVVYHPQSATGDPISASDPDVLERQGVGFLSGSTVRNGKLVAEAWFDVDRLSKIDSRVLQSLRSNKPVEISTGLYTDNFPAPLGSLDPKGRSYNYIARNYKPDHLAILPDQIGACSIKDGCGLLVNKASKGNWKPVTGNWQPITNCEPSQLQSNCGKGRPGRCKSGRMLNKLARAGRKKKKASQAASKGFMQVDSVPLHSSQPRLMAMNSSYAENPTSLGSRSYAELTPFGLRWLEIAPTKNAFSPEARQKSIEARRSNGSPPTATGKPGLDKAPPPGALPQPKPESPQEAKARREKVADELRAKIEDIRERRAKVREERTKIPEQEERGKPSKPEPKSAESLKAKNSDKAKESTEEGSTKNLWLPLSNTFCKTGKGGGIDPSCGSGGGGKSKGSGGKKGSGKLSTKVDVASAVKRMKEYASTPVVKKTDIFRDIAKSRMRGTKPTPGLSQTVDIPSKSIAKIFSEGKGKAAAGTGKAKWKPLDTRANETPEQKVARLAKRKERRVARKEAAKKAGPVGGPSGPPKPPGPVAGPVGGVTPPVVRPTPPVAPRGPVSPGGREEARKAARKAARAARKAAKAAATPKTAEPGGPAGPVKGPARGSRSKGSVTPGVHVKSAIGNPEDREFFYKTMDKINRKTGGGLVKLLDHYPLQLLNVVNGALGRGATGTYSPSEGRLSVKTKQRLRRERPSQEGWSVSTDNGKKLGKSTDQETIMIHEMAHHIDYSMRKANESILGLVSSARRQYGGVSKYANTSDVEYWAESFAAHMTGAPIPAGTKTMVEEVIKRMKKVGTGTNPKGYADISEGRGRRGRPRRRRRLPPGYGFGGGPGLGGILKRFGLD